MTDPKQQALTRYYILRSSDEGKTAEFLGDVLATSSEQALKKWFADPPRDEDGSDWYAAASQNALRWRQVAATVKTTIREAEPFGNETAEQVGTGETESLKV